MARPIEMPRPSELIDLHSGVSLERDDAWPTAVVRVVGELDVAGAPSFGVALTDTLRERPDRLVVDLCKLEFLDSTGLAVLLNARRRAVRAGIELALVCDVPSTLRLLRVTRLNRDFNVFGSIDEALAAT